MLLIGVLCKMTNTCAVTTNQAHIIAIPNSTTKRHTIVSIQSHVLSIHRNSYVAMLLDLILLLSIIIILIDNHSMAPTTRTMHAHYNCPEL